MKPSAIQKELSLMSQLIKTEPEAAAFIKEGDLVEARLLPKSSKAVYFDLGKFGTGAVDRKELSDAKNIIKNLKIGDSVSAKIVSLENDEGFVELSLAGAHKQKEWQALKEMTETGEIITVKIKGANSGGLISEINNIKAFLPTSQLSNEHYPKIEIPDKNALLKELRGLVGQELKVKIIDLNPRFEKLIVSERAAIQEDIKKLIAEKYKIGDVIDGVVSGIANLGVFVRFADQPSIEGLVSISELSRQIVEHPKEIVNLNDAVKAKIIDIKDNQVLLSLKALQPDPWEKIEEKIKADDVVRGAAVKFMPLGAVVNLADNLQGIIHAAEFGGLEEMKKQLEIGKERDFIVESVKPQEKRINLKLLKP